MTDNPAPKNTLPRVWGLVLSRKGSKRLPNKAMQSLAGQPMIQYTFAAASASQLLETTWVFTDDTAVLALAKDFSSTHPAARLRLPDFKRPEWVSHDEATSDDTVRYFLSQFSREELPDLLVLLQATSPLRTGADIDAGIRRLQSSQADMLMSVTRTGKPRHEAYRLMPGSFLAPAYPDTQSVVVPNGALYVVDPRAILDGKPLLSGRMLAYVMSWHESVDVDTADDLRTAETMLRRRQAELRKNCYDSPEVISEAQAG